MELKSMAVGAGAMLMALITIGAALAAIVPEGTQITVPTGKWAIYHFVDNTHNLRVRDAVRYWEGNNTLTATEAATVLNNEVKGYLKEYVLSAEANLQAEAARQAAMQGASIAE